MMKKIIIPVPKEKKKIKETPEERAERIRLWATTRTRVVPSAKVYDRKKFNKIQEEE